MIPKPDIYGNWETWASDLIRSLEDAEPKPTAIPAVDKMPAAGREYRGVMLLERDPAGDVLRICIWNGAAYTWVQIAP